MEKLKMQSPNLSEENREKIKELFPDAVAEIKDEKGEVKLGIDFDILKQELSDDAIEGREERYQMTWPGKRDSIVIANTPSTKTLRPSEDKSLDFEKTKNVYIEGDNLDALKILRETYLKKVKVIYIDPPYNTGNDFVYKDKFVQDKDEFTLATGQEDESGNRLVQNSETNGRFHTDWINMIYPRLRLAKDFLTDDGAIFISIGDDEEANLIKICDEIFGENNFICSICHKSRASVSNDRIISENHNHILFYAKNEAILFEKHKEIGDDPDLSGFNQKDEKGAFKLVPVDGPGGAKKGNPYYEFLGVKGYWRYSQETMQAKYEQGLIVRTESGLQQKYYQSQAEQSRRTLTTWWDDDFLTSSATSELAKLMGAKVFDNPKSVSLILRILKMMTFFDKNALIMDFFSGSATTAEAVMRMNSLDGGSRRYILVQLQEKCGPDSDAFKAGYQNICEIGEKRIKLAAEKIRSETKANIDFGLRVFYVDSSNMKDVYYSPNAYSENLLSSLESNIKDDRNVLDLLTQVMLQLSLPLSSKIEKKKVQDSDVFFVNDTDLAACFDKNVSEPLIEQIAAKKPLFACFTNASFLDDSSSVNCEQIFKTISPNTRVKII